MTPELQAKVAMWRSKAIAGTLTQEEMLESVKVLREGRIAAQSAAASSTTRTKKPAGPPIDAESLLNDLMEG
jgi:hypothetical protein